MTSDDADVWKRRERALGAGVVAWAVGVALALVVRPDAITNFVLAYEPPIVAGTILVSIGVCGALAEGVLTLAGHYASSGYDESLTDVPWDE